MLQDLVDNATYVYTVGGLLERYFPWESLGHSSGVVCTSLQLLKPLVMGFVSTKLE